MSRLSSGIRPGLWALVLFVLALPVRAEDRTGPHEHAPWVEPTEQRAERVEATYEATAGEGAQVVTLLVRGAQPGSLIRAEAADIGTVDLRDPGVGYLRGELRTRPRRSLQLRFLDVRPDGTQMLYDNLLMLPDGTEQIVAFEYVARGDGSRVVRIPAVPPASSELWLDPRVPYVVGAAWGGLVLLYLLGVSLLARCRRGGAAGSAAPEGRTC